MKVDTILGLPFAGPKALPVILDFTIDTSFTLDYENMQARNFLDMVQSAWIDNELSNEVLTITIPASGQVVQFPKTSQGYITLIVPNPIKIQFDSRGGQLCSVILLNFPISNVISDDR